MKIRAPNRLPVQSLGREKIVRKSDANNKNLSSALSVVDQMSKNIAHARKVKGERDIQQAALFTQKVDNEFTNANSGIDLYNVDDLPKEIVTEGMLIKGRVPSAEIYPEMYKRTMDSALKDASMIIEDQSLRSEWLGNAKLTFESRLSNIQNAANKSISAQIFKDQKINFTNALSKGDTGLALQIAKGMNGSKVEINAYIKQAKKSGEINAYKGVVLSGDLSDIQSSIDFLSGDSYEKDGGELNNKERVLQKHNLETQLNKIKRTNSSSISANKKIIGREIKITIQNLLDGKASKPDVIMALVDKSIQANISPAEIKNLFSALEFADRQDFQNKLSKPERDSFIDTVNENKSMPEFEKAQLIRRLEASSKRQFTKELEDIMQSADDAGFIELSPLDSNQPAEFAMQLVDRFKQMKSVEENYGIFNNDMLTKSESASISSSINNMSVRDQIPFIMATTEALGEDAVHLYEQLSIDGYTTSFAIAGIASVKGTRDQAEAILMGNEYRRNNKDEAANAKKLVFSNILKDIGNTFANNPGMQKAVKDATLDAYIHYVIANGGSVSDVSVDDDAYDRAILASTGGIFDYAGSMIRSPEYGMQEDEFESWIDNISTKYIDSLGGIEGMNSASFLKSLRNGEFILENEKYGSYIVNRMDKVPLKSGTSDGYFTLVFDRDVETIPKIERKVLQPNPDRLPVLKF